MARVLTPWRLIGAGLLVLAAVVVGLWLVPSNEYVFLPDRAHPVSPLVTIPKDKQRQADPNGGIYFVDVFVRKASLFERLFHGIRHDASYYPAQSIVGCDTPAQERQQDVASMTQSQRNAAVVALRAAGYKVPVTSTGVRIDGVACDGPAHGKLDATDMLISVDGKQVRTTKGLITEMRRHRPGDVVHLAIRDADGQRIVAVKTVADRRDAKHALIGISIDQDFHARLPFPVRIDAGGVGGPSAGLAFALDLMEKLGRDVDHGYKVAATGELSADGTVGPIGGVKQKTVGARRAGVDVFLVPAGDNAAEARRYAKGLRIIPVETFPQALRALATLPARS